MCAGGGGEGGMGMGMMIITTATTTSGNTRSVVLRMNYCAHVSNNYLFTYTMCTVAARIVLYNFVLVLLLF